MMSKKIIIIGAGAHAKVVLEAILSQGIYSVEGFCADKMVIGEKVFVDYAILGDALLSNLKSDSSTYFIVAIGDNIARQSFFDNACKKFKPAVIVHPKASVSPSAKIAEGTVVLSNSCINSSVSVGKNTIVNIGVLIDHDSCIGKNVHLSVGTIVGCESIISDNSKTKIGEILESFSKI